MIKVINYYCEKCNKKNEMWFESDEKQPVTFKKSCKYCGGDLIKFNFKDNPQVWKNPETPHAK